jgi:hypothetical protein
MATPVAPEHTFLPAKADFLPTALPAMRVAGQGQHEDEEADEAVELEDEQHHLQDLDATTTA